jgi:D-apionolactonase
VHLRAGPLTADVVDGDLRGISLHGVEVVQRLYATVRDEGWRTAETVVRGVEVDARREAFEVHVEAESVLDGATVAAWRLRAAGAAAGTLDAELRWRATADFSCNRVGLCVHHPTATWAGAAWRASAAGAPTAGRLGDEVAPQPLVDGAYLPAVGPFESLTLERGGVWMRLTAPEGEPLELEDQRNWGDASYKSYPSPVPRSARPVRAGATGCSRLTVAAVVAPGAVPAPSQPALRDAGGGVPGVAVEAMLVVDAAAEEAAAQIAAGAARIVGVMDPPPPAVVVAALRAARPARAVALGRGGAPPEAGAVAALERAIAPIAVGTGTLGSFSELNRCRDRLAGARSLSWSLDPQVHASDARSIMENVPAIGDQLATAAAVVPGAACHVACDLAAGGADARRGSAFEAAWLVGVLAHAAGRAASILVPPPAGPTAEVVAQVGPWQGMPAVVLADPRRRVAGVGVRRDGRVDLLLANLTPRRIAVRAAGRRLVLAPYEVRSVTASA